MRAALALLLMTTAAAAAPTRAVVVAVQATESFLGNDEMIVEDGEIYVGVHEQLIRALDALPLATYPGTLEVIRYTDRADIVGPWRPVVELPARLPSQRDAVNKRGVAVDQAIELGGAELSRVTADEKLLVVIGNGRGEAATALATASRDHIQVLPIVFEDDLAVGPRVRWDTAPVRAASGDDVARALRDILAKPIALPVVVTPPLPPVPAERRSRLPFGLLAAGILGLSIGLVAWRRAR